MQDTQPLRAATRASGLIFVACILFAGTCEATEQVSLNFDTYLAEGYRQVAGAAVRVGAHASLLSYYKKRSADAANGRAIVPQVPNADELDPWTLREANFARNELIESLRSGSSQRQPLLAAIAQVNFDCWVMPLPRQTGIPDGDECRRRFYFAFAGLSRPNQPAPPGPTVEIVQTTSAANGEVPELPKSVSAPPVKIILRPAAADSGANADPHTVVVDSCDYECLNLAFIGPAAERLISELRVGEGQESARHSGQGAIIGVSTGAAGSAPSSTSVDAPGSASTDTGPAAAAGGGATVTGSSGGLGAGGGPSIGGSGGGLGVGGGLGIGGSRGGLGIGGSGGGLGVGGGGPGGGGNGNGKGRGKQ
jgi:hypothetical protein